MNCTNCGTEVASKFCPNCGQPSPPKKITLANMYHDFQARIYGFDGMFPRTLRDITLRPGKASRAFIQGNRVQYYGPVGYFFLMITVMLLLMSILDVDVVMFMKNAGKTALQPEARPGTHQAKFTQEAIKFVSDNIKLISFLIVPIYAMTSRYIFFRKAGFNMLEHSVLPFYVQGHVYWISILNVIFYKITGMFFMNWLTIAISIGYFSFAYADFFSYQSKVKALFKGLGVYLLAQLFFMIIVLITVLIAFFLNPDLVEMLKPSNNR